MKFDAIEVADIRKPERKVYRVFLHCSASDDPAHDYPLVIDRWHRERGFDEIGYHFFIQKDGTICEGRSLEKDPAAQAGHNKGTIAICCHGLEKGNFTKHQMASLKALCWTINKLYKGGVTFHGHREVNAGKTCPVFSYKELLNLNDYGLMMIK